MNTIKKQYQISWEFMKKRINKTWIFCIIIFILLVIGITVLSLNQNFENFINGLLSTSPDSSTNPETWYEYLYYNGQATLINIMIGIVPFIPLVLYLFLMNALGIGLTLGVATSHGINPILFAFFGLVPHGIFEVPANCLGSALGLVLWIFVTKKVIRKNKEPLLPFLIQCLRVFVLFILPLLLVAGIIEANITPIILNTFM